MAALPVTLLLDKAPAVESSLSTSVTARSLAMSSSFKILGTLVAASLPAMCFLGEGLDHFFCLCSSSFLFSVFLPVSLLLLIATSFEDFILTGVTDELLAAEEDGDDGSALRRVQ